MAEFERHIVDIEDIGLILNNFLASLFQDHEMRKFVYNETISQIVMAVDNDQQEFYLRLLTLPDFSMFDHLIINTNDIVKNNYTHLYKALAVRLFNKIYETTNPMNHRAQYFCDACTLSYIVVVKSMLGNDSEFSNRIGTSYV